MTVSDVITMSKSRVWDDDIIRKIEASRTVFHLGAEDIVRLHKEGVSDHVINFMLETHTRDAVMDQRIQDSYFNFPGRYYPLHERRYW